MNIPVMYQNVPGRWNKAAGTSGAVVRAYQTEVPAGRRDRASAPMAADTTGDGRYRLRSASDTAWPTQTAYGRRAGAGQRIASVFNAVLQLLLPVFLLLVAFTAVYLYLDTNLAWFADPNGTQWLTVGHLLVPLGFLCVQLTNRRYGAAHAFAQVVVGLALAVAFVMFAARDIAVFLPFKTVPDMRIAIAAGAAFFGAGFISIVVFDGARGPRWWTAPLFGFAVAAVIFSLIFYPAAYSGVAPWSHHMLVHMGLLVGAAVLMLLPYWLLRGMVRPLPGYGGY